MSKDYPSQRDVRTPTPGVYRRSGYFRVLVRENGRKVMHRFETYEAAVEFKKGLPRQPRGRRLPNDDSTTLPRSNPRLRYLMNDPCAHCSRSAIAFDHIEPRSLGGSNHWSNVVGICGVCNRRKGTQSLLHFLLGNAVVEGTDLYALLGLR